MKKGGNTYRLPARKHIEDTISLSLKVSFRSDGFVSYMLDLLGNRNL